MGMPVQSSVISAETAYNLALNARRGHLPSLGRLLIGLVAGQAYATYAGNPNSNLTPSSIGQNCLDTTNGVWYKSKSLLNTGWAVMGDPNLSTTELEYLDGVTAGTALASKALVLDSGKGISTITSATITTITSTTGNITTVNATTGNITTVNATTVNGTNGNVTGNMTVGAQVLRSAASAISAAGTVRGNATALTKDMNNLGTVGASTGVSLPAAVAGMTITVNNAGANSVQVYALGSDTIDGVAGSTGVPLANAKRAVFQCFAAPAWISAQQGVVSA